MPGMGPKNEVIKSHLLQFSITKSGSLDGRCTTSFFNRITPWLKAYHLFPEKDGAICTDKNSISSKKCADVSSRMKPPIFIIDTSCLFSSYFRAANAAENPPAMFSPENSFWIAKSCHSEVKILCLLNMQ